MAEMPDLSAFSEGGTFINNGALMAPVIHIYIHLQIL